MPRSSNTSIQKRPLASPPVVFRNPLSSVTPTTPTPSFGQSMKDGFGLGMGSAIAHRVVGSIFGAPTVNVNSSPPPPPQPCDKERYAFEACMKTQSMETFCGQQQLAYTSCIQLSKPASGQ